MADSNKKAFFGKGLFILLLSVFALMGANPAHSSQELTGDITSHIDRHGGDGLIGSFRARRELSSFRFQHHFDGVGSYLEYKDQFQTREGGPVMTRSFGRVRYICYRADGCEVRRSSSSHEDFDNVRRGPITKDYLQFWTTDPTSESATITNRNIVLQSQLLEQGDTVNIQFNQATGGDGTLRATLSPSTLPAGLRYDAAARRISGTVTTAAFPVTRYTYTVTDTGDTVDRFPLTVTFSMGVGDAPDLSISSQSVQRERENGGDGNTVVRIVNGGTEDSLPTTLRVMVSSYSDRGFEISQTRRVRAIRAGTASGGGMDTASFTFENRGLGKRGGVWVRFCVDTVTGASGSIEPNTEDNCTAPLRYFISDLRPSFDREGGFDLAWVVGEPVEHLGVRQLPLLAVGNPPITYRVTPEPPAGVTFDPATASFSGAPTAEMERTQYTLTAIDADNDRARLNFHIRVGGVDLQVDLDVDSFRRNLTARVFNTGTKTFRLGTTLRFYRSSDSAVTPATDTEVRTESVPFVLTSGGPDSSSRSRDFRFDAFAGGGTGGLFYACVDAAAGETDTTNNCSNTLLLGATETGGVTVFTQGSPLRINEGGSEVYTVRLQTDPGAAATVTPNPPAGIRVSPPSLTFTSSNWEMAQTVTLTAAQDDDTEDETAVISHTVENYGFATAESVSVYVVDDDTPAPDLIVSSFNVRDNADVAGPQRVKFDVAVQNRGTGDARGGYTVAVYRSDDGTLDEGDARQGGTTVFYGLEAGSVTSVDVLASAQAEGNYYYAVCVERVSGESDTTNNCSETVSLAVSSAAQVIVRPSALSLKEGESVLYTVALGASPASGEATIAPSSDNADVTLRPSTLTFTADNWNVGQTVTVSAAEDSDTADDSATVSHAVSGYGSVTAPDVSVAVRDNDIPRVEVAPQSLEFEEGSAQTYTVVLNTEPGETVTVTPSSDNADVTLRPSSLTFTADNWNVGRTVTLSAAEDSDSADDSATVSHTVSGYGSVTSAPQVSAAVNDNDTDGVTLSVSSLAVTEGGSETYTVVLDTEPGGDVTVTPEAISILQRISAGFVTVSPSSLTFTADNWNVPQRITVSAAEDSDTSDGTALVRHAVSGYGSVATAPQVSVEVTDDSARNLRFTRSDSPVYPWYTSLPVDLQLPLTAGGDPPVTFTVDPALPAGLTMSAGGRITGTPETAASLQTYTLTATDTMSATAGFTFRARVFVGRSAIDFIRGRNTDMDVEPGGEFRLRYRLENSGVLAATANVSAYRDGGAGVVGTITPSDRLLATVQVEVPAPSGGETVGVAEGFLTVMPRPRAGPSLYGVCALWHEYSIGDMAVVATDSCSNPVTVTTADRVPSFSASPLPEQIWIRGESVTLRLPEARGGNGRPSYELTALPAGLTFGRSLRRITGTPTEVSPPTVYTLTARDRDAVPDTDTFTFFARVEDESMPAFSDSVDDLTWNQDSPITAVTLPAATGGNGDVTYSLSPALPAGLSFDSRTREITGTPTVAGSATVYTLTATDSDSSNPDSATLTFRATVSANPAPSFTETVSDQMWTQNTAITTLTLPEATGGDGTPIYILTPALPAGLSFDSGTRQITGTPTVASSATAYTLTATDADGDSDRLTFRATVAADLMPSFTETVTDRMWTQNTAITALTLPAATGGDGTLTYGLSPALPTGLSFDSVTRRITGTPTVASSTTTYTLTATDSDSSNPDSATLTFRATVAEDLMPSFGSSSVSNQMWVRDTAITALTLPAATGGNGRATYRLTPALPTGLSFDSVTRRITGTPTETSSTTTYTLTATDADGDDATLTFRGSVTIGAGLVVPSSLTVNEGRTTTYTVRLRANPRANVNVALTAPAGITVDPTSLTFTTDNWNTAQTVTVMAAEDANTADETLTLRHTASGGLSDTANISVTVNDNDTAGVTVSESTLTIDENASGTYTMVLDTLPGGTVTITPSSDNGDVTLNPSSLEFTTGNWNTAQTVTVSAAEDADTADDSATVSHTVSGYGSVTSASQISVTVNDNDRPDLTLENFRARGSATRFVVGTSSSFDFTLFNRGQRTAPPGYVINLYRSPNEDLTNREQAGRNTFNGRFSRPPGRIQTFVATTPSASTGTFYYFACVENVTGETNTANNCTPAIRIEVEQDLMPSFANASAVDEQIWDRGARITPLTLPSAEGGDGSLTYSITTLPAGLTFGATNRRITGTPTAGSPRTVYTLTATDSDASGADTATFTFTARVRGVAVSAGSLTVDEGSAGTYTVVLEAEPSRDRTVTITPSSNNGDVTVNPSFLTFTTGNWDTAQTVTVSVAQDSDSADESATVSHAVSGYGSVITSASSVAVTVIDDETDGVTVSASDLTIDENASGTYTVVLDTEPGGSVTITPSSNNGDVTVNPSSLTFTTGNWNVVQTVTVSAAQDDDSADDSATVSHSVSGYGSVTSASSVAVTVTDDDTDGVTVSLSELTTEEGSAGTYTVVLDTEPGGEVTITPSSDNGDVTVSPSSLTFTIGDWDAAQTVTVSAAEDDDGADDTATLSHTVTGYGSAVASDVTVTVSDNDPVELVISAPSGSVSEGRSATYTVRLNTEPSGTVRVTPSGSGLEFNPSVLTFTTSDWNRPKTVEVSVASGTEAEAGGVVVSHSVLGYAGYVATAAENRVTVMVVRDGAKVVMEKSLAVLGRTLATGAVETISERFSASGSAPGSRMRGIFNGRKMTLSDLKEAAGGGVGTGARTSLSLESAVSETEAEVTIAGGGENEDAVTLWMKGDFRKSEGKFSMEDASDLSVDAETYSSYLGLDYRLGEKLLLGFALSGSKSEVKHSGESKGNLDVTLASIYPYVHWSPHEGLELWAVAGAGKGEGDLERDGEDTVEDIGIGTRMFAGGARQGLLSYRWFDFSAKTDAYAIWMDSDSELESGLESADASVQRLRFALEGRSRDLLSSAEHNFASGVEIGGRLDSGDGGSGLGADVGLSVGYAYIPGNVSVDARGRFLVFHEDSGFRDWGAGLTARVGSGANERGLSLSLSSDWGGESSGGVAKLWESGEKSSGNGDLNMVPSIISGELGYGLSWRGSGLFEPFAKLGTGSSSRRRVGMGARLSLVGGMLNGLGVELLGEQKQREKGLADDYRIGITGSVRF